MVVVIFSHRRTKRIYSIEKFEGYIEIHICFRVVVSVVALAPY